MPMKKIFSIIFSLLSAAAIFAVVYMIDILDHERRSASEAGKLRTELNLLAGRLEQSINYQLQLTRGLAAFVRSRPNFSEEDFERFANALAGQQKGIRSLQLAPKGIVTYVTNKAENAKALGHDLLGDPTRRKLALKAVENREYVIAGPINLIQGGQAVIARLPVFLPDAAGGDEFWGFATILIDPVVLLRDAGILEGRPGVDIALRGKDALGKKGAVFHGNPRVFENLVAEVPVTLAAGAWSLGAAWTKESIPLSQTENALLWALGGLLAAITGIFVYLSLLRRSLLQIAVKTATGELQANQEKFSDFAQASADWFWEMGPDLRFTYLSERAEEVTGVPAEFHYGKSREELAGEDAKSPEWLAHLETLRRHEPFKDFQYLRRNPNGKDQYISTSGIPVFNENGTFAGYRGTASEVTERVQAEIKIEQFKTTLDRTQDCIFMFRPDALTFFYVNQGALDQVGYTEEELFRMRSFDIKPEFDEPQFRRMLAPLIEGPQHSTTFETIHEHKNGTRIPVEIFLQYIAPDNEDPRFVAIVRDISERKKHEQTLRAAEQKIRENEALLLAIFNNTPVCLNLKDTEGRYLLVNKPYEEWFGVSAEEIIGKKASEFLKSATEAEDLTAAEQKVLETGEAFESEISVSRPDGKVYERILIKFPVKTETGEIMGLGTVAMDITERKEAEAAMVQAREEAEAANKAKSQFLSSMSHELRTPLNSIMGFGQLLEADLDHPLSKEQRLKAVRHILRGGAHLLELINQVLDLAKIESGNLSLSIESVEMAPVIAECLTMAEAMADKLSLSVQTDLPDKEELPIIQADRTRLQQVLLNLLSNAAKYNIESGSITLSGESRPSGAFRLTVADTGHGIPEKFHGAVFSPFNRLAEEGGTTEGTGIGLAITREIVELMGGKIGFSSVEGEGSSFWFELPMASEAEASMIKRGKKEASVRPEPAALPSCTVLYVEDNPANLELMEMILEDAERLTLKSAPTAELGIEIAKSIQPDLVLMDINLPGMDGLEALRVLKSDPKTRNIPVVAVSANAMPHDIKVAMDAGFNSYITKPFDIPQVFLTISGELGQTVDAPMAEKTEQQDTDKNVGDYAPLAEEDVGKLFIAVKSLPPQYLAVLKKQAAAIPVLIANIQNSTADGDATGVERAAHTLKTNSGTFGARKLWAQAQNVEEMARGNSDDIPNFLAVMEDEFEIIAPVIDLLLKDLETSAGPEDQ